MTNKTEDNAEIDDDIEVHLYTTSRTFTREEHKQVEKHLLDKMGLDKRGIRLEKPSLLKRLWRRIRNTWTRI